MRLFDQHVHSWNSFDSKADPADVVRCAIEAGLSGISFTEHFDTHPSEWDDCAYDDDKIAAEIQTLRDAHGDRLFVGKGIEVCYQPQNIGSIIDFLAGHEFDVVILSVHWAFGKAVHQKNNFADMTVDDYLANYLEAVCAATDHVARLKRDGGHPFNILGHMDFARRYAKSFFNFDGPIKRLDLIEQALKNCLDAGIIPEINTSTLRNGLVAPMPGPEVVQMYAELGGDSMPLGSDAHQPRCVGNGFDVAIGMLKAAGIKSIAVFKRGQLTREPI